MSSQAPKTPSSNPFNDIDSLDPAQAHQILKLICRSNREIHAEARRRLTEARALVPPGLSGPASTKRKAPVEPKLCHQCDSLFDEELNHPTACSYHGGFLELNDDDDFWADNDEDCHGPNDTEENRKEYPEGFKWDCCERQGDGEGCLKARHVEAVQHQKPRLY